ncbi:MULTISPECIES: GYD domain-containing protein [Thermomonospora]|uniref:Uncharacterized protein with GYD domain n=1 Tax=Thermomonospora cellulosilytica TaxID=1411118 RepID=A0A7W3R6Z8_9ACTN|nr:MULTISPECIES: GYD domain-containing protein [Thermomonospora]MBA9002743.1 uncharacterized protein with GYD domain [Thermomonospora cellulosilytica]
MSTGVAFMKWTDQGVRNYRETLDRYEQTKKLADQRGVEIKEIFWTPGGPYDIVSVAEAPEDKTLAAFMLSLESLGNLRITWASAYGPDEMREVITD